ncbi:MAG: cytidylate kinase [Proteobacteria bacterium]|nr:MAG: cytidylate kinase [Pseudomonadota bacterium]
MVQAPVITIDGPAGSGKGTVSQRVATKLSWHILDSGALYRLVAHAAMEKGCTFDDVDQLADIARNLEVSFLPEEGGVLRVILEGADVSSAIRSERTGEAASKVAVVSAVREALLERQRAFAELPGLVADGRDMGTAIFPDASLKIYLTASAEVRAQRRLKQLKDHGLSANLAGLVSDIQERDARDMNRDHSPLRPAEDAHIVDTSALSIDEVVSEVLRLYESRKSSLA